ncbi:hypothetical protein FGO68_gene17162 [Halteria grandinella]|uniref:RING-type domain-containing protein n=1 Tax=Halteria grandinella TaxID=5974 RepID=A0A8J8T264_HALGN|nr:hypothetical protein FGO68_gene17162 [Halteria grandinella]
MIVSQRDENDLVDIAEGYLKFFAPTYNISSTQTPSSTFSSQKSCLTNDESLKVSLKEEGNQILKIIQEEINSFITLRRLQKIQETIHADILHNWSWIILFIWLCEPSLVFYNIIMFCIAVREVFLICHFKSVKQEFALSIQGLCVIKKQLSPHSILPQSNEKRLSLNQKNIPIRIDEDLLKDRRRASKKRRQLKQVRIRNDLLVEEENLFLSKQRIMLLIAASLISIYLLHSYQLKAVGRVLNNQQTILILRYLQISIELILLLVPITLYLIMIFLSVNKSYQSILGCCHKSMNEDGFDLSAKYNPANVLPLSDISPLKLQDIFDLLIIKDSKSTKFYSNYFTQNKFIKGGRSHNKPYQSSTCPICFLSMTDAAQIAMPCSQKHACHPECLLRWLQQKSSCPLCKCLINIETLITARAKHDASFLTN